MIDDLLTPLTSKNLIENFNLKFQNNFNLDSSQQRRFIEFFLHQTIFYLSSLDEIRQELSINLPSSIYSRILSSRLIERLFEFKQRTYTPTSTSNLSSWHKIFYFFLIIIYIYFHGNNFIV